MSLDNLKDSTGKLLSETIIQDLPPELWHLLTEAFRIPGSDLPSPSNAGIRVMIEVSTSKIMGFVVVQRAIMAQPAAVYPEFEHLHVLEQLYQSIDNELKPGEYYFVNIAEPALQRKAEKNGFIHIPGEIFAKVKPVPNAPVITREIPFEEGKTYEESRASVIAAEELGRGNN